MNTVFCLDVCPAEMDALYPDASDMTSATYSLALPSRGGALTLTMRRLLHSSKPSMPVRDDLGDTRRSISIPPLTLRLTSDNSMLAHMAV